VPIPAPGFDLGVGIERLAAVLQDCDSYRIDNILPLVETVRQFLLEHSGKSDEVAARICSDHFRSICALSSQGITSSNKGHGYVLRKLTRRFLETIWSFIGKPESTHELIRRLSETLERRVSTVGISDHVDVTDNMLREERALLSIIQNAQQIICQHPKMSPQALHNTFGISKEILVLAQQNQTKRKE
jgi:alanyl-tRNA synthetase